MDTDTDRHRQRLKLLLYVYGLSSYLQPQLRFILLKLRAILTLTLPRIVSDAGLRRRFKLIDCFGRLLATHIQPLQPRWQARPLFWEPPTAIPITRPRKPPVRYRHLQYTTRRVKGPGLFGFEVLVSIHQTRLVASVVIRPSNLPRAIVFARFIPPTVL